MLDVHSIPIAVVGDITNNISLFGGVVRRQNENLLVNKTNKSGEVLCDSW